MYSVNVSCQYKRGNAELLLTCPNLFRLCAGEIYNHLRLPAKLPSDNVSFLLEVLSRIPRQSGVSHIRVGGLWLPLWQIRFFLILEQEGPNFEFGGLLAINGNCSEPGNQPEGDKAS